MALSVLACMMKHGRCLNCFPKKKKNKFHVKFSVYKVESLEVFPCF